MNRTGRILPKTRCTLVGGRGIFADGHPIHIESDLLDSGIGIDERYYCSCTGNSLSINRSSKHDLWTR